MTFQMSALVFCSLVLMNTLCVFDAVPTSHKTSLQKLTKVGVEAIRNDLSEGIHKLREVHGLMLDDERVRIIAMHQANRTHQLALQHLITEWENLKYTNQTCVSSLQELYVKQCIPCLIWECVERYDTYCRLVPVQQADVALLTAGEFETNVRGIFEDGVNDVLETNIQEWFTSSDDNLVYLIDELDWLWLQIQRTAEDISAFGTGDARGGWLVDITDEFIEFFINNLNAWLKREGDEIVDSVTDRVDGWFDNSDESFLENVKKTLGSFWDDLTDWVDDTKSAASESLTAVKDDVSGFYNENISRHVTKITNKTVETFHDIQDTIDDYYNTHLAESTNDSNKMDNLVTSSGVGDKPDDVTEWFDDTFSTVFKVVANKTREQVDTVFGGLRDLFGGRFHDRRRRSTSDSSIALGRLNTSRRGDRQATCKELNDDGSRGQACMAFASKCPDCNLLPQTDCAGLGHAKEAVYKSLVDFTNATAMYKTVFEAFREGQEEYYSGLQSLASRYRWIANFQQLPLNKRGYRILKLNFEPAVEDSDPSNEFSPVEVTVVMFGESPYTFVVDLPVNPMNYDIAGTVIAARALAKYASHAV
uniref:Uncharacterized protein LOC102807209 n=1 Tax=Saccoglossus kowalevskii TaxID=10224 RepID=A0ABM0MW18_SACKO|nr:PREDICTED: uncharacterized protein LOC102807209 [Saccoglossus kowalevskii]